MYYPFEFIDGTETVIWPPGGVKSGVTPGWPDGPRPTYEERSG